MASKLNNEQTVTTGIFKVLLQLTKWSSFRSKKKRSFLLPEISGSDPTDAGFSPSFLKELCNP